MELTQRRVWIQILKQIRMDRLCKKLKPCEVEDMAGEVMIQRVHPAIFTAFNSLQPGRCA